MTTPSGRPRIAAKQPRRRPRVPSPPSPDSSPPPSDDDGDDDDEDRRIPTTHHAEYVAVAVAERVDGVDAREKKI